MKSFLITSALFLGYGLIGIFAGILTALCEKVSKRNSKAEVSRDKLLIVVGLWPLVIIGMIIFAALKPVKNISTKLAHKVITIIENKEDKK